MIVDAHQHYWDPVRGDYGWLERGSPLDRRFLLTDLRPLLASAGVDGTVLVQVAPTLAETDWLLDLARDSAEILGVVGWVDLDFSAVGDHLASRCPRGLVGIRPMLQDLPDPDWILGSGREAGLRAVAEAGLAFDALVRPVGFDAIARLAERHPDLTIVLDHAGKPPFGDRLAMSLWRHGVERLAALPNIWCKLSGLLTEVPSSLPPTAVVQVIDDLIELWGASRLLWGSDWPVLTLASDYQNWMDLARDALAHLNEEERNAVFGGNAIRIYRLEARA